MFSRANLPDVNSLHIYEIAKSSLWPFYRRQDVPEFSGGTIERFVERLHARMFDYVSSAGPPIQIFGSHEVSRVQRHGSKRETEITSGNRAGRLDLATGAASWEPPQVNVRDNIPEVEGDQCSSVIFIKQLITMYVIMCIPLYVNMCESYAFESFLYTFYSPLTLDKVTIMLNFLCYNSIIHLNAWKIIIKYFVTNYFKTTCSLCTIFSLSAFILFEIQRHRVNLICSTHSAI